MKRLILLWALCLPAYADYFSDPVKVQVFDSYAGIVYGYTADVRATGNAVNGRRFAVGQQINVRCTAIAGVCWAFGGAFEVYPHPNGSALSPLIGLESAPISLNPYNPSPKVGINLVLKNRKDSGTTIEQGDDLFNYNSWAVLITSQPSLEDESMGWSKGIYFGENSLGYDKYGLAPAAIDLSRANKDAIIVKGVDRATGIETECFIENSRFVCRPY